MKSQIIISHLKPNAQNVEMWFAIDLSTNETVGHVFMNIEPNNRLKLMDAWVSIDYRRQGIYRMLWDTRWEYVCDNYKNYLVYAWCKNTSLPLLIEKGFATGEVVTYVEKKI